MHEKTQGSGKKLKDLAKNSSIWRKKLKALQKNSMLRSQVTQSDSKKSPPKKPALDLVFLLTIDVQISAMKVHI